MKLNAMLVVGGFLMLLTPGASATLVVPDLALCLDESAAEDDGTGVNGCFSVKAPPTPAKTTKAMTGYSATFTSTGCEATFTWSVSGSSSTSRYTWDGRASYLTTLSGSAGAGEKGVVNHSGSLTVSMLPGTTGSVEASISNDDVATDKDSSAKTFTCPTVVDLEAAIGTIVIQHG